ncbi:MAG: glycoside hydrolase family 127 protein [Planctomycetota bacterium]|nr:glycoside hydrolase family 127 protein [Planctomycetota bacterium]
MQSSKILFASMGCPLLTAAWMCLGTTMLAAEKTSGATGAAALGQQAWMLPEARDVQLGGPIGEAYRRGQERLSQDPYRSAAFLRSDFSFEQKRIFTNYSGDISGRFIEIASLTAPAGKMSPNTLPDVLQDISRYQKADGHFGYDVDWSTPLEPESPHNVKLPIFWGNSRLLVGLLDAQREFARPDLLQAARRIGDFYVATADRFLDPARMAEYRSTGTYAAGYVTDYFPGIEGLVRLYQVTHDDRYLQQAERMAEFFRQFDTLPIDHSHGNLITHYGLLLLYETTGKQEYLQRPLRRWQEAVEGGYVWPMGGVGERFRVSWKTDEGCSEADWLRLNLRLWQLTGETRFLNMAERLLWNHYAMNRTANGGYGHHNFVCDAEGPLVMQTQSTEAVWCCTFHGLLGLHTLHRYVVAGSQRGLFINFPLDVRARVQTPHGVCQVTVSCQAEERGTLACRVRIDPQDTTAEFPAVFLRRPTWAESFQAADANGRELAAQMEDGYLRFPVRPGAAGEVVVTFASAPRVESRRSQRVELDPQTVTRHRGIVLWHGSRMLLANSDQSRPVVVALVGPDGRLILPQAGRAYALVTVASADATEEQIAQAAKAGSQLVLAPWEAIRQNAPTALVFDLIAVPTTGRTGDLDRLQRPAGN